MKKLVAAPLLLIAAFATARDAGPVAKDAKPAVEKKTKPPKQAEAAKKAVDAKADEAEAEKPKGGWSADTWSGLELRGIGPAVTSGRIVDIAVDPTDKKRWFLAVASGGVFKTENAGTTWTPVFDGEGSYSIGCVAIDPHDPNVVWVGTGENNSQRSVGYGDGVYKSEDGGKSWKNVGLKASEHVGKILVHPKDSNVVYVAAQGPLWAPGGDRGLYKTTDGGQTWNAVLTISENTGVTDVVMDPRDPDTLIAAAYQRRRHVFTLIDGGPESGLHKTTDGGKTWKRIKTGLPKEEMGRIGLAIAPTEPDTVYALVETAAADKAGGTFRSTNRGETLGEARRLRARRTHVLPGDLRRPEGPRAALLDGRLPEGVGRRREDLAEPRRALQARGQPRDLDRPRRHRPLPRRVRRRPLREPRPGRDVALLRQPPGDPVLPRGRGQLVARLLRLRRHPGQQHGGRPLPHPERARRREPRLVRHLGRRRLPRPGRPHRPQHRLLDPAVRRPRPLRPPERRSGAHPAAGEARRRSPPLELGQPPRPFAPQGDPALLRGAARVPERGPGRQLDAKRAATSPGGSTATG